MAAAACAAFAPASPALGAAGDPDPSFGGDGLVTTNLTPGVDAARGVAVQADGKIVVAGRTAGGGGQFAVARYTVAGVLDTTFSGDGKVATNFTLQNDEAFAVALEADGKIVVAGLAAHNGGRFALARYNADGTLDHGFSGDGRVVTDFTAGRLDVAHALAIQGDGKIVAAGEADVHGGQFAVARYDTDGTLDTTFSGDGSAHTNVSALFDQANGVAVQADGRIVLAGFAGGAGRFALVRFTTAGTLDPTFGGDGRVVPDVRGFANAVAIQPNGKIVAAGGGMNGSFAVARINADGTSDSAFGIGGATNIKFSTQADTANGVAIQADGKIVAVGVAGDRGGRFAIARFTTAGFRDHTFAGDGRRLTDFTPGDDEAAGVAIQANGRIVVAGFAARLGGRFALARYLG
jgi:uncharacterized delta-60 repeat protein